MSWFKVDDSFASHPKCAALEAGPCFGEAVSLWTLAGSWSASQLTDGVVPIAQLRRLVPFAWEPAAAELVRVGLWELHADGFVFHDWLDYQPSRAEVLAQRSQNAERQRRRRHGGSHAVTDSVTPPVTPPVTHADVTPVVTAPRPVPSRPVPEENSNTPLAGEGTRSGRLDPEHVRNAYVGAYRRTTGGKLEPLIARGFGNPIWDELAKVVVDAPTCTKLLDAAFADEFCRRAGFTPNVILQTAPRLLLNGPEGPPKQARASPRGGVAPPASHAQHRAAVLAAGGVDGIAEERL